MSVEACGSSTLRPASAPHPQPGWGLGLSPKGGQCEKEELLSACCPILRVCACVQALPWSLPTPPKPHATEHVLSLPSSLLPFLSPSPLLSLCLSLFFIFQKISSRKGKGAKKKAQEIPV